MTAALVITGLGLSFLGLWWLIRRCDPAYRTKLQRTLDAHRAYEADIRRCREDPPQTVGWGPPAGRGAYARYRCGCVEHLDGREPRWQRCSPHQVDAEIDRWPA